MSLTAHYLIYNSTKILARRNVPLNECTPYTPAREYLCQGLLSECESDLGCVHCSLEASPTDLLLVWTNMSVHNGERGQAAPHTALASCIPPFEINISSIILLF